MEYRKITDVDASSDFDTAIVKFAGALKQITKMNMVNTLHSAGLLNATDKTELTSAINTISASLDAYIATTNNALAGKVDKISGKGLSTNDYSNAEKQTLADLSTNFNALGLYKDADGDICQREE